MVPMYLCLLKNYAKPRLFYAKNLTVPFKYDSWHLSIFACLFKPITATNFITLNKTIDKMVVSRCTCL